MRLPSPRGTLTTALFPALRGIAPLPVDELVALVCDADSGGAALEDDDVHTALWATYQLHYAGFDDVDDRWEWDPDLLRLRRALEDRFLAELRFRTADLVQEALEAEGPVADRLFAMTENVEGPALAAYLRRDATREEMLELLVQRSIHNLQESDPQAFVLPRVGGRPKVALAELLYDEFGAGRPERLHSGLFARGLAECGLDDEPGAYVSVGARRHPGLHERDEPPLPAPWPRRGRTGPLRRLRGDQLGAVAPGGRCRREAGVPGIGARVLRRARRGRRRARAARPARDLRRRRGGRPVGGPRPLLRRCGLPADRRGRQPAPAGLVGRGPQLALLPRGRPSSSPSRWRDDRRGARSRRTAGPTVPAVRSWCGVPPRSWTPRVSPTR